MVGRTTNELELWTPMKWSMERVGGKNAKE